MAEYVVNGANMVLVNGAQVGQVSEAPIIGNIQELQDAHNKQQITDPKAVKALEKVIQSNEWPKHCVR